MRVFYERMSLHGPATVEVLHMTDAERDLVLSYNGNKSRLDLTIRSTTNARMEFYNDENARYFVKWLGRTPPEHFPLLMPIMPQECL